MYNLVTAGAIMLAFASTASAQDLTEAQARSIIAPWYSLFNGFCCSFADADLIG